MTDEKEMSFDEEFSTYMKEIQERMPGVLKAMLDNGVPIYYRAENGHIVEERPNGEITDLEKDEHVKEETTELDYGLRP